MTYEHKVKSLCCGLHWTAYSWQDDWKPNHCPECGAQFASGGYMHWKSETDQEIFMLVPGESQMAFLDLVGPPKIEGT